MSMVYSIMSMASMALRTLWRAADISGASYDSKSFNVQAQTSSPWALYLKPDGTKMYVGENGGNQTIYQYTLGTAYDISTASYDSKSFNTSTQVSALRGFHIKSDGTKMYTIGSTNNTVYQYTLSTAWDVSTATYDNKSFSVASQGTTMYKVDLSVDGTKMYAMSGITDTVYQYTLSTAWDVSTASYDTKSLSFGSQEATPRGFAISVDGTKVYAVGSSTDTVYQYTLSIAWDVSTGSYDSVSFSVAAQDINPNDLHFIDNGTKMYIVGQTGFAVYQYTTG